MWHILKLTYQGRHRTAVESDVYDGLVSLAPHPLLARSDYRTIVRCECYKWSQKGNNNINKIAMQQILILCLH